MHKWSSSSRGSYSGPPRSASARGSGNRDVARLARAVRAVPGVVVERRVSADELELARRNPNGLATLLLVRWILDLERGPEAFDRLVRAMGRPVVHELTRREWQVLDAAAAGLTRHETAELLGIGFETVKTFRRHAQAKLDATNITHAVAIAIRRGLLL